MYQTLTFYHSIFRWLVLVSLLYAIYRAYRGYISQSVFSSTDNYVRHWTATSAHIQLMTGILLYSQSPVIKYFIAHFKEAVKSLNIVFFGLIHISLMLAAIILITIGSARAKRMKTDAEKFKTMLVWFSIALIIIFIAIPWPFSPLTQRPYFR